MKRHKVTGGGGIQLNLVETGNSRGRPILFIHGFSQCWLAWSRQLNSDLADGYRLVAMDMRGDGLSDKPREGYADSRLWADDVNAAIQALSLDHAIFCGWSYGPLVILDYMRHYGENRIVAVSILWVGLRSSAAMRRCLSSPLSFSASYRFCHGGRTECTQH
jgi:pimeloyl-ACP methyl ester carboxylesterase